MGTLDRRQFIVLSSGLGLIGCGAASDGAAPPATAGCARTSSATAGPYYLTGAPELTRIPFDSAGTALRVEGTVVGSGGCGPLAGARLDLWQCDANGDYDQTGFRGRGVVVCDANGRYAFDTIMPANYRDRGVLRPAHIHYTVTAADGRALTTQLYFAGDPHLDGDRHVHSDLVRPLAKAGTGLRVSFDIAL